MTRTTRFAVAILVFLLIAAAWLPVAHDEAIEHSQAGLKRALGMYAVARGMNAIISVVQGTEFGVGVVVAAGQVLDPINDLIEQFAALMLMAVGAFGLQILLIKMGAHWVLPLLLTLAAVAWLSLWWRRDRAPNWLVRILLVLLLVRFAVPVSALASEAVYRGVMAGEYAESEKVIRGTDTARRAVESQQPGATIEPKKWPPPIWDDTKQAFENLKAIVADMKQNAEKTAEHMVRIAVVFLLQTLVLPLLFLWLLIAVTRKLISGGAVPSMLSDQRQR